MSIICLQDDKTTRREGEILNWLADSGYENTPWLALDDAVWQFDRCLNQLIPCTCYIGLDDAVEAKLRSALKAAEF